MTESTDRPFLERLRDRKIVQWALAYVAGAWLLLELSAYVIESFGWPVWLNRALILAGAVGFLVTLVLAWYHGAAGRQRTRPRELGLLALLVAAGLAALVLLLPGTLPEADAGEDPIVAVMPFRSLGTSAEMVAPGITTMVRDRLEVLDGLRVFGATTTESNLVRGMTTSAMAERWGVDYVLKGAVERTSPEGPITVRPELYAADGSRLGFWSEPIIVDAENLSSVERTIATDVANAIDVTIGEAARSRLQDPRNHPEAYATFLRALRSGSLEQAETRLHDALAVDSTFAPALAHLAQFAMQRFIGTRRDSFAEISRRHALAAIRQHPQYADPYGDMGTYHRSYTRDQDSALFYYTRAKELAPGSSGILMMRATALWNLGRLDSALAEARRGAVLDPLDFGAVSRVSRIQLALGELDEAYARHLEIRDATSLDFVLADGSLILAAMGRPDSARALLSAIRDSARRTRTAAFLNTIAFQPWLIEDSLRTRVCGQRPRGGYAAAPHDRQVACALAGWRAGDHASSRLRADSARRALGPWLAEQPRDDRALIRLAYAHFLLGDSRLAIATADSSIAINNAYWDYYEGAVNAIAYARLVAMAGDIDRTVSQLRPMLEGHSWITSEWIAVDPAFDSIRTDPRFRALVDTGS